MAYKKFSELSIGDKVTHEREGHVVEEISTFSLSSGFTYTLELRSDKGFCHFVNGYADSEILFNSDMYHHKGLK